MSDFGHRIEAAFTHPVGICVRGCLGLALLCLAVTGCRTGATTVRQTDSTLQRHAKRAAEAYAEGHVDQAIAEYRKAVRRAWAMDDPYESGTAAYNLAACLASNGMAPEARDWLLDARVELKRAGYSAGNVWLLEAKIAQEESRLEEVPYLIQRAACSDPPCAEIVRPECCDGDDPCGGQCVARIPCLGPRLQKRQAVKECEQSYQAQLHLMKARFAAEQYDIPTAQRELECACDLATDVCSCDLHAELHNVAALIHIAKGEYLQAARHLDRETQKLRWAENYREIPNALNLASAAYEQAGLPDLAAERLCRAARVFYGRDELQRAWRFVQLAGPLAEAACAENTKIRLSLLANEILHELSEQGEPLPPPTDNDGPEMLSPANAAVSEEH